MIIEDTQNKQLVAKQLQKVESVGKTGKMKKGISLSNDFSSMLRSYMTEFSFKILAYVIKGYIIILKKNYENFYKEISHFMEINLKMRLKAKKEDETKEKHAVANKADDIKSLNPLNNFLLLSNYSQNDLSGFSSDLANQFLSTIKKMKKSHNPTIKSLYEGVENSGKLEFLIKNFSENVKKSQDLFNNPLHMEHFENNNLVNIFQQNENLFSDYINLSMKIDDARSVKSIGNSEKNRLQEIIEEENEPLNQANSKHFAFFGLDEKKELLFINKLGLSKEAGEKKLPFFRFDKEINLSSEEILNNLIEAEKLVILEQQNEVNSKNLAEASRDNMKIYLNNFKKLSVKDETSKFEQSLISNEKINYTIDLLNYMNVGDNFQGNNDDTSSKKTESIEQFRTDKRKSLSFNNSIHLSNLTINDVFENKQNVYDLNSNEKSKRINFNENIQMIIEEDSNLNTLTYNFNKNAFQQLKSELDCNYVEENNNINYSEIDHEAIKQQILEKINNLIEGQKKKRKSIDFSHLCSSIWKSESESNTSLSFLEKSSLVFYNFLFLSQENNYNILQESIFGCKSKNCK